MDCNQGRAASMRPAMGLPSNLRASGWFDLEVSVTATAGKSARGSGARYLWKSSLRPMTSGGSTLTMRSNRPARTRAGSSMSGRLVPARMRMFPFFRRKSPRRLLLLSKPSISTRSWFNVLSESIASAESLPLRRRPIVSTSSMKMMQRPSRRARAKSRFTIEVPTPAYSLLKSEPAMEIKGMPASPATALAIRVFPVPGGPTSSTPFGILAPRRLNLSGFLRNSRICCSSDLASSQPTRSESRTWLC
mmetsp:Transcript_18529/g.53996  ORF Transcript_18529/g.53996 Transcript_18529/m.53996 type:complete len:248 (-) Transcript_18529:171-914(-)